MTQHNKIREFKDNFAVNGETWQDVREGGGGYEQALEWIVTAVSEFCSNVADYKKNEGFMCSKEQLTVIANKEGLTRLLSLFEQDSGFQGLKFSVIKENFLKLITSNDINLLNTRPGKLKELWDIFIDLKATTARANWRAHLKERAKDVEDFDSWPGTQYINSDKIFLGTELTNNVPKFFMGISFLKEKKADSADTIFLKEREEVLKRNKNNRVDLDKTLKKYGLSWHRNPDINVYESVLDETELPYYKQLQQKEKNLLKKMTEEGLKAIRDYYSRYNIKPEDQQGFKDEKALIPVINEKLQGLLDSCKKSE